MGLPNNWNAQLTDVGQVRSENQDSCHEFRDPSGTQLLVVADGMGGHQGGATASRLAIEAIGQVFARAPHAGPDMLREALEAANERVYRTAAEHPELHGMGTTCVALWAAIRSSSEASEVPPGLVARIISSKSVKVGQSTPM